MGNIIDGKLISSQIRDEIAENVKIRIDKGSIYQSVQDASENQANNGNAAAK